MANGTHDNNSFNNGKFQKFPYTPASDPTQDFHVVNKRFVGSISSRVSSSVEALRTSLDAVSSTGGGSGKATRVFEDTDAKISTGDSSVKVVFNSAQFSVNRTDTESVSVNLAPSICITGAFEASTVSATSISATVHRGTSISVSEILAFYLQASSTSLSIFHATPASFGSISMSGDLKVSAAYVSGTICTSVLVASSASISHMYCLSVSADNLDASSITCSVLWATDASISQLYASTAAASSLSVSMFYANSADMVSAFVSNLYANTISVGYIAITSLQFTSSASIVCGGSVELIVDGSVNVSFASSSTRFTKVVAMTVDGSTNMNFTSLSNALLKATYVSQIYAYTASVDNLLGSSISISGRLYANTASISAVWINSLSVSNIWVSTGMYAPSGSISVLRAENAYICSYLSLAGGASINTSNFIRFNADGSTPLIVSAGQINTYSPIYGLSTSVRLNDYGLTASSISMSVLRGYSLSVSVGVFTSIYFPTSSVSIGSSTEVPAKLWYTSATTHLYAGASVMLRMSSSAFAAFGKVPVLQPSANVSVAFSAGYRCSTLTSIAICTLTGGLTASINARFSDLCGFVGVLADRLCSVGIFRSA